MTREEEMLTSLAMLGDDGFDDAELDRRVTGFRDALRRMRVDPAEAARIDALVMDAERGQRDVGDGASATGPDRHKIQGTAPPRTVRGHERWRILGRFLVWLSGAQPGILADCPTERPQYLGIGTAVLLTSAMAAISLTFALTALNVVLWMALPFGFAWGLFIMSLDRWLVVSLQRQDQKRRYLALAVPRLLVAAVLGLVISTPFSLQIFRPEIEHEIPIIQAQAAATYYQSLSTDPLTKQIAADQARVNALTTEINTSGQGINLDRNPELNSLIQRRDEAQKRATVAYAEWQCQLYGVSSAGDGRCTAAAEGRPPRCGQRAEIPQRRRPSRAGQHTDSGAAAAIAEYQPGAAGPGGRSSQ